MNLKILSIVTGLLLLVAAAGVMIDRQGGGGGKGRVGSTLMANIDISDARAIHVLSEEGELNLKLVDGKWLVQEQDMFPAGAKKIQAFLFRLARAKIEHEVTSNPDKLAGLGLLTLEENNNKFEKDKTATVFTIKDESGKNIYQLLIGTDRRQKKSLRPTVGGQYVRFADSTAAYLIPNPLFLERISKDWLRAKIFDFEHPKMFSGLRIRQPGKKDVVITRKDAESPWRVEGVDASKLNKDELDSLVRRIGDIEVSVVADRNKSEKALGRGSLAVIDIDLYDKRAYRMDIGLKSVDEEFRYIKLSATLDPSVQDDALKKTVSVFNDEFAKRRIGVYDWEAEQLVKTVKELLTAQEKK